jgi:methionyl aminopeptidase
VSRLTRRSPAEVVAMRRAGKVVAEMHETIRAAIRPGVTTLDLDRVGRRVLERRGATSNFLGYHGFPAVICASPNEVVIHGIPGPVRLDEGDLISVDCGAIVDGWHGDAAFTVGVGAIDAESQRLIDVSEAALAAAIAHMRPGQRLSDVSHAVGAVVEAAGLEAIEGYGGHGIGRQMHEAPDVPNSARPGRGPVLTPGVVLAIEPMVVAGRREIRHLDDGWSVVTADGRRAAHVEHTVAVTDNGPEILTV